MSCGDVAPREDPSVHCRVERDDAVPEHLGEAGQLLERRHRDAVVLQELRGAAAREQARPPARCSPFANAAMPRLS